MKIKKFLILVFISSLSLSVFSQTQTIRGKIFDQDTHVPLIGATIQLESNKELGTNTDINGHFVFENVPVGRQNLSINYLGYEQSIMEEVLVTATREILLEIFLKPQVENLEEVVVYANSNSRKPLNETAVLSARSMTMEELNRNPATFFDPARMALGFAGVAQSGDDLSNEIVVRGNSPRGILWRLEGIEIPNPNHFGEQGSSGGGISMLSTNVMGTSDFFSGAFPAEYGNALSGVFDIKLRNGNYSTTEAALQVGLLGLNVALEGPISKKNESSYLINYRYSTLGILDKIGFRVSDGIPDFQDLSFKLNFPSQKLGTFAVFGLGGNFSETEEFFTPLITRLSESSGKTGILVVSNFLNLSNNTYLKTVFATSYGEVNFEQGNIFNGEDMDLLKDSQELFEDTANRFSMLLNHKINDKNVLRVGGIFSHLGFDVAIRERDFEFTEEDGVVVGFPLDTWAEILGNNGNTYTLQSYLQWKNQLAANLTLNVGLHYFRFGLNSANSLEPRLGLKWQFNEKQSLALAVGRHSRIESLGTYFVERTSADGQNILPNKDLPLQKANHYVLSYDLSLGRRTNFKIETYYQQIDNLAISSGLNSTDAFINKDFLSIFSGEDHLIGDGRGRNYGIDLSLDKRLGNDYYFQFNSSLFKSEYQTTTGEWYNTRFSSNYNVVALGGKEFQIGKRKNKAKTLGLNGKAVLNGGLRFTPLDEDLSLAQQETVLVAEPFSENLPYYFRVDLGIYIRRQRAKTLRTFSLNVQNLTNRQNVRRFDEGFNVMENNIVRRTRFQTGLVPVLSYRIEF